MDSMYCIWTDVLSVTQSYSSLLLQTVMCVCVYVWIRVCVCASLCLSVYVCLCIDPVLSSSEQSKLQLSFNPATHPPLPVVDFYFLELGKNGTFNDPPLDIIWETFVIRKFWEPSSKKTATFNIALNPFKNYFLLNWSI